MKTTHLIRLLISIPLLRVCVQTDATTLPVREAPATLPHVTNHVVIRFKETSAVAALEPDAVGGLNRLLRQLALPAGASLKPGMEDNEAQTVSAGHVKWMILDLPESLTVESAIEQLKDHPLVEYVEPDMLGFRRGTVPDDPALHLQLNLLNRHFTSTAGRADVHAPEAWDMAQGSDSVVVAILDTGLNSTIPDFAGRLVPGRNTITEAGSDDTRDTDGHGTIVASAGFATGNDGNSVAGIDWNCKIMPLRMADWNTASGSMAARAFIWATDNGADVISISWYFGNSDALRDAINYALNNGVIVVNAFGNDDNLSELNYLPDAIDRVIHVGGSDPQDRRISFATYSPKMDLMAPASVYAHKREGSEALSWGTSFAAPQVAAAVALLVSQRPGLTSEEATALVCASADDLVGDATDRTGFDIYHGWGRLNVARALRLIELGAGGNTSITSIRNQFSPDVPEMILAPLTKVEPFPLPRRWETSGQWGPVTAVVASSDNRSVVSAGSDGRVLVWDLTTGGANTLVRRDAYVTDMAMAADGRTVAIAFTDGTVQLKDIYGGSEGISVVAHDGRVTTVDFSPDGSRFVTGGNDATIKVWDSADGSLVHTLTGHTRAITGLAITSDGNRIISGSLDRTVKSWSLADGTSQGDLSFFAQPVHTLAASPVDQSVAVADINGLIVFIDAETKAILNTVNAGSPVETLTFLADGSRLVSGDAKGLLRYWRLGSVSPTANIQFAGNSVLSLAVSPDGSTLIAGGLNQTVRVYDPSTRSLLNELGGKVTQSQIGFSSTTDRLVSRGGKAFTERDARTGVQGWKSDIGSQAFTTSVAYHPAGTIVATSTAYRGDITIRDAATGTTNVVLSDHALWVHAMAFTPDGTRLISSDEEGMVAIWNASTYALERSIARGRQLWGAPGRVIPIAPDSSAFVEIDDDGIPQAWNIADGQFLRSFPRHNAHPNSAAFSPDGAALAVSYSDGAVRLFTFSDGAIIWETNDWNEALASVCFSPDGQYIVAGGSYFANAGVGVWRAADGLFIGRFASSTGDPTGVNFVGFVAAGEGLILGQGSGQIVRVRANIPATRFTGISHSGDELQLQWEGNYPRYRVQKRTAFGNGNWSTVSGTPFSGTSINIANDEDTKFFRVQGVE